MSIRNTHRTLALLCLLLSLALAAGIHAGGAAASEPLNHFSNATYVDRGYGIYAAATEVSPGQYDVHVSLQLPPFFGTSRDIAAYTLVINDTDTVRIPPAGTNEEGLPADFAASVTVQGTVDFMRVIPVLADGSEDLDESLLLPPSGDGWDAPIGTTATVRNPQANQRLNLRAKPDSNADVWMQYYNGVAVEVLNVLPDGWVAVHAGNAEGGALGYMKADFLAFGGEAQMVAPQTPALSTSEPFILYRYPEGIAEVLATFPAGTSVTVLGLSTTWRHVQVGDATGYMRIAAEDGGGSDSVPPYYAERGLRYYARDMIASDGHVIRSSVTEYGDNGFDVNVHLVPPDSAPGGPISGFNLYVNGAFKALIPPQEAGAARPLDFYTGVSIPETIQSLRLVPVLEQGVEATDAGMILDFDV